MASVAKSKPKAAFSKDAAYKLESSGLTVEDGIRLGMYDVSNAAAEHKWFEAKPAMVLPYYDINGRPLKPHKTWPEFFRIRYLGKDVSFTDATGAKKPLRYSQPSDTGVCAYFPTVLDWGVIAKDHTENIIITEGEFKAAKACVDGFPAIGLGGVYNFRSAGSFFLPELEQFVWPRRRVFIVYDSDYKKNPQIVSAINTLAEELQERGALCNLVTLEDVYDDTERKTGLDDYLVERGSDAFSGLLDNAEPLTITQRLWQMNNEVCYVADPGFVVDIAKGMKVPIASFTGHSDWATQSVPERKVGQGGKVSYQKVSAAQQWIKWPLRKRVDKLSYLPGREIYCTDDGADVYNTWRGWGVEPVKGDVKPFLELIDFIFHGSSKDEKDWVLDWMAYPIKYPGAKLFSAILVHGRATGTGKTFIGYTLGKIYGQNFKKIKNEDLHLSYWAENTQFVLGDEISGTDKRTEMDLMKTMITQEEITINIKFIPQFTIPDCVNYYMTSQHADALWLEDEDRRFFVHEVPHDKPMDLAFYAAYDKWLNNGGASHLMYYLQNRDINKDFNPKGPPPRTASRDRMVTIGKSDIDAFCADLRGHPQTILRVGQMRHQRDLFTSKEIMEFYLRDHENANGKITPGGVARALAKAGFKQAYDGMPIPTLDGKSGRYYIIRNRDTWLKGKTSAQLAKHIALSPVRD